MCFISSLCFLFIWLSLFSISTLFMTLGSSKKRNFFLVPHIFFFRDNVIWVWFGIPGNWRWWRLREGADLLRNGMDVFFTDNEASSPTKFTTVTA